MLLGLAACDFGGNSHEYYSEIKAKEVKTFSNYTGCSHDKYTDSDGVYYNYSCRDAANKVAQYIEFLETTYGYEKVDSKTGVSMGSYYGTCYLLKAEDLPYMDIEVNSVNIVYLRPDYKWGAGYAKWQKSEFNN